MIGSSLLMASFGFMVYSVSPAIVDCGKDKIIPKNADGRIN